MAVTAATRKARAFVALVSQANLRRLPARCGLARKGTVPKPCLCAWHSWLRCVRRRRGAGCVESERSVGFAARSSGGISQVVAKRGGEIFFGIGRPCSNRTPNAARTGSSRWETRFAGLLHAETGRPVHVEQIREISLRSEQLYPDCRDIPLRNEQRRPYMRFERTICCNGAAK